ncbi:Thiolase, N-terminal domain-containing protein [Chaetomidium leptoderma]|uniref:acetyl-CoA C-acyltransferase n=1 Tax=Chaetomidium leptoderma TaxID=669021 RepID=A0AAN6ZYL9_9PEZI|nr:Thiolase, N-terminal domain-containing protein [Chaetomidium leptoderma]
MSSDSQPSAQVVNGFADDGRVGLLIDEPTTPLDDDSIIASSQQSLPPTEAPNSPLDPTSSFNAELNEDRAAPSVIPSSLTPPPSSQVPNATGAGAANPPGYHSSQRTGIFSPPATGFNGVKRESVADASIDELRSMLQSCMAEQARLKMEAAHHKLQFNMLSIRAEEDTKRAVVEHEMAKKEVQALQQAECARKARRDITTASESTQAKYMKLKVLHEQALDENDTLHKKVKAARRVIQQKEDEVAGLTDEREMLLNRIRENREHFHLLCSPGGMFHGAVTPKVQATSPQQHRATPRQTPKAAHRDQHQEGFAVLLQALSQDNNSAPSTPLIGQRPAARVPLKHTRNVQSMSSLPSTPLARNTGNNRGLLPSIDLVPQTEPPQRHTRFMPETPATPRGRERRKSRESTISAEDNQELARQALQSFVSRGSQRSQSSRQQLSGEEREQEEVFESQASQAASEMLRRNPRESFDVAASAGNSRDGTPAAADRSAKLQAKLFGGLNKGGLSSQGKRKFSGQHGEVTDGYSAIHDRVSSPTKKLREVGGLRDPGRAVLAKAPTDVVILSSLRTPICRSYRGQLKDAYPEELLSVVLRATLDKNPQLDPAAIDDVAVGVVLNELGGSKAARMAMNHVGFPSTTSLYTTNRACSSSLQSIALVASQIRTEMIDVGIGAGMESMTRNYGSKAIPVDLWPALRESAVKDALDCIMPMGLTSENVASRYGVSRADQDALAVESHRRAARARESGAFDAEIVPVTTRFQETDKQGNKVGDEQTITVTRDDGIRANATAEALGKLKPAFLPSGGASTAGNSSQVSDGAAATLLMRRSTATQLGLADHILGKFVGAAVAGCAPDEMGVGPALAIPRVLGQLGLTNADVDRWEINEAFASQALYCVRKLGLERELAEGKVNPDGGAIALGHPLGATGARMVSTLMHGLGRSGGEVGVVSMCIGTGMGMAGVFVRE